MIKGLKIFALSLLLAHVGTAWSVEVLSTTELAAHCAHLEEAPEAPDAVFCVRYIQGFIDGAIATDERVTKNVVAEYANDESFSERAMRTRGPVQRLTEYGATYYAEFCLGDPVPLDQVVEVVINDLQARTVLDSQLRARDTVYHQLRTAFPCKAGMDAAAGE